MPRVAFRSQARAEIREARRWYEAQVLGLGRAFIAELDATLAFLMLHPEMYAAVSEDGKVRRTPLHRFPYSLICEVVNANEIVVLACRHVRTEEINWNVAHRDV
jgi:plasmid stabilization system protein ParE